MVFHYPGDAATNFIKRLVGLPGETVRISRGALWTRPTERPDAPFQIARKTPAKLLSMLEPVFENDRMKVLKEHEPAYPERWSGIRWQEDGTAFQTVLSGGQPPGEAQLEYCNLVPSYDARTREMRPIGPALISDFVAYNAGSPESSPPTSLGLNWVGDLALECTVQSRSAAGQVEFELVKGGRRFGCRIDLASGEAALSISGDYAGQFNPRANTALKGRGTHRIRFANCDDRLLLWVDDRVVPRGNWSTTTCYDSNVLNQSQGLKTYRPRPADLTPVRITSRQADLTVSHLNVMRNIYYIADDREGRGISEFTGGPSSYPDLADPGTWYRFDNVQRNVEFPLHKDQFFMLGDNSACSKDGRLWGDRYWVDRDLLIGKALCIYWPHSWDEVTVGGYHIPFPFFPNFSRMGFVK